MTMQPRWRGFVRMLVFPVEFERDLAAPAVLDRVVRHVVHETAAGTPLDFALAIDEAFASGEALVDIIPGQPHDERALRDYLRAIRARIQPR